MLLNIQLKTEVLSVVVTTKIAGEISPSTASAPANHAAAALTLLIPTR